MDTTNTAISGKVGAGWCVYTLKCEWRRYSQKRYKGWQYAASKANGRVYVGSTNDLERRLQEHKKQTNGRNSDAQFPGSEFTSYFPPKELIRLEFCEGKDEARYQEEQVAEIMTDLNPGWFVWQN